MLFFSLMSALFQFIFTETAFPGWHWYDCVGMSALYSLLALLLFCAFPPVWIIHLICGVFIYHRSYGFLWISLPLAALVGICIPQWAVISMGV